MEFEVAEVFYWVDIAWLVYWNRLPFSCKVQHFLWTAKCERLRNYLRNGTRHRGG